MNFSSGYSIPGDVQGDVAGYISGVAHTSSDKLNKTYNNDFGLLNEFKDQNNSSPNAGLQSAIAAKSGNDAALRNENQGFQNNLDSKNDYFRRLQNSSILAEQERQLNRELELQAYQAKMAKRKARSAVLGSLLGVAGAVGGAVAGSAIGGPMGTVAGAGAGFQIGKGAGGMIGGSGG